MSDENNQSLADRLNNLAEESEKVQRTLIELKQTFLVEFKEGKEDATWLPEYEASHFVDQMDMEEVTMRPHKDGYIIVMCNQAYPYNFKYWKGSYNGAQW